MSSLSLTDAVHPEGTPWILPRLDPSIFQFKKKASLVAQLVKNPPSMQETPVQFLGQEDLLEKE